MQQHFLRITFCPAPFISNNPLITYVYDVFFYRCRRNDKHSPCSMSTGALGRFYRRIYLRGSGVTAGVGAHQVHGGGIMTGDVDRIKFRNCDDIFDEVDQLQYSWCVFHLVLCGAALFVMLTLTNLYYPKRSTKVSQLKNKAYTSGKTAY